jgi:competence ComEA-like helix-hairpin-helix protein
MNFPRRSALLVVLCVASFSASADSDLPEGKGKEAVENNCTDCHSVERIKAQRLDEEGWNGIMREMMETGASINSDDIQVIVEYLTKNFGPDKKLNVNKAGELEIASVLRLTSAEAKAIVQHRTRNGEFKNLSDLEKVDGLAEKIKAKKALIEF